MRLGKYEHPAIVVGGGISALQMIRNLGRNNVDVYSLTEQIDEANLSRYCKGYFNFPEVEHGFSELDSFLTRFRHELGDSPVVLPASDSSLVALGHLKARRTDCIIPIPTQDVVKKFAYKYDFYRLLSDAEIPHPRTVELESAELNELQFPLFLKPSYSQDFEETFGKKGFVINSKADLRKYSLLMREHNFDALLQEIISGPATNGYFVDGYLDQDSKTLALFARKKLRSWPTFFGNTSLCVSVPIIEVKGMKDSILRLLTSLRFRGLFSAEFKIDARDRVCKLLDVNLRGWWNNSLSAACGVNIILAAYLDAIGKGSVLPEVYEAGHYSINFLNDLKSSTTMIAQGHLPSIDWITSRHRLNWSVYSGDDPRPLALSLMLQLFRTSKRELESPFH